MHDHLCEFYDMWYGVACRNNQHEDELNAQKGLLLFPKAASQKKEKEEDKDSCSVVAGRREIRS